MNMTRAEYLRKWRAENKEKYVAYYQNNKGKRISDQKKWNEKNKEKIKEYQKKYREATKELKPIKEPKTKVLKRKLAKSNCKVVKAKTSKKEAFETAQALVIYERLKKKIG